MHIIITSKKWKIAYQRNALKFSKLIKAALESNEGIRQCRHKYRRMYWHRMYLAPLSLKHVCKLQTRRTCDCILCSFSLLCRSRGIISSQMFRNNYCSLHSFHHCSFKLYKFLLVNFFCQRIFNSFAYVPRARRNNFKKPVTRFVAHLVTRFF